MDREPPLDYLASILDDETPDNPIFAALLPIQSLLSAEITKYEQAKTQLKTCEETGTRIPSVWGLTQIEYGCGMDAYMDAYYEEAARSAAVDGLATAILVTSANLLRIFAREAAKDLNVTILRVWKCGAKEGESYWADAVDAASNYVRHSDEWRDQTAQALPLIKAAAGNLEVLCGLGLQSEELRWGRVNNIDLVEKLHLLDWDKTHNLIRDWTAAVVSRRLY